MIQQPVNYEWVCPICSESNQGLTTSDQGIMAEEAKNALNGHVRATPDDGHGPAGDYPAGYDPDAAHEYIEISADRSRGDA